MRVILLGLMLAAAPVAAQSTASDRIVSWKQCVLSTAEKWAGLKEQSNDIASGALGACASLANDVQKGMQAEAFTFDEAQKMVDEMKVSLTEQAMARVLQIRAKKP